MGNCLHTLSGGHKFYSGKLLGRYVKVVAAVTGRGLFLVKRHRHILFVKVNGLFLVAEDDGVVLIEKVYIDCVLCRSIVGDIELHISDRKQVLILHRPFCRVSRQRTVGIPRLVLDHVADVDDDIAQRLARSPYIAYADLPVAEVRVPYRGQYPAQRLIARVFGVERYLHLMSAERFYLSVRQQIDAVYEICNMVFLRRHLAYRSYDYVFMSREVLHDLLIVRSKAAHSCGHCHFFSPLQCAEHFFLVSGKFIILCVHADPAADYMQWRYAELG